MPDDDDGYEDGFIGLEAICSSLSRNLSAASFFFFSGLFFIAAASILVQRRPTA